MISKASQSKSARHDLKSEIGHLKRERIIATAAELFAAQGYHGISVEAVADALGVTKPFIYSNFRDKNELLVTICRRAADLTFSAVQSVEKRRGTNLDRLADFCFRLANIILENRLFIAIYAREDVSLPPEERAAIARVRADIDRYVCELLERAVAAGEADVIDPPTTATAMTTMISALWYWYRKKSDAEERSIVETIVALAMRMAGARAGLPNR
jgi:AcrR family transcriptional regulator